MGLVQGHIKRTEVLMKKINQRYLVDNIINLVAHSFKLLEKIPNPGYTFMFQIHNIAGTNVVDMLKLLTGITNYSYSTMKNSTRKLSNELLSRNTRHIPS